jgi:CBS domain-containing protein
MKVKDVMHKGTTCVVGAIPVKADSQLVGIVTDRDIACRALADSGNLAKMTAKDVMTKDVVCCSPEDDVQVAIEAMEAKQIRRLPVTDSHKTMIGVLSLGDISHKVSKELSGEVLRAVSGHHV